MEPEPTEFELLNDLVRQRIMIGLGRHCRMECGIDHHVMRDIRKYLHSFLNNAKRNGIMQRRQRQALFDLPQTFTVKDRRLFKILTAMNKAMPHGIHVNPLFHDILRCQTSRCFMIRNIDNILLDFAV